MLDIAIPQNTGYPAEVVEECLCPPGYEGLSCEACARGHYRDAFDRSEAGIVGSCKMCDCNGNEQSCGLDEAARLVCNCLPGFSGSKCENPPSGN